MACTTADRKVVTDERITVQSWQIVFISMAQSIAFYNVLQCFQGPALAGTRKKLSRTCGSDAPISWLRSQQFAVAQARSDPMRSSLPRSSKATSIPLKRAARSSDRSSLVAMDTEDVHPHLAFDEKPLDRPAASCVRYPSSLLAQSHDPPAFWNVSWRGRSSGVHSASGILPG